jgi:hypothetical protein
MFHGLSIKFLIDLFKFNDQQISLLGSHGLRLDFRPHKICVFVAQHKIFYQIKPKTSPKTVKLVNISCESEKEAEHSYEPDRICSRVQK